MSSVAALTDNIFQSLESELIKFACSAPWVAVLDELSQLPEHLRHEFVDLILLNKEMLALRGVEVPNALKIKRSYFADGRPTLFCIVAEIPPGFLWEKITITYDNEIVGRGIPPFARGDNGELLPFLRPPTSDAID